MLVVVIAISLLKRTTNLIIWVSCFLENISLNFKMYMINLENIIN